MAKIGIRFSFPPEGLASGEPLFYGRYDSSFSPKIPWQKQQSA
jgi:hypothetical protein